MTEPNYFSPALFEFLSDLKRNNDREWFKENQSRYEEDVKAPAMHFIADFGPRLRKISKHLVANPRKSMFRIHRDIRFSRDKSPYKTHVGIQFRHEGAKDVHAPGFYLHLEPGSVFVGAGIWRPDNATLRTLRDAIVDDPTAWKRARNAKRFSARYDLEGDSLKRAPRGYDADHPLIEDLRRKDFIGVSRLGEGAVTQPDFMNRFAEVCADSRPFMRFLCSAVGVPF
jgi:uncharacterized protein (TIGR02453 family)